MRDLRDREDGVKWLGPLDNPPLMDIATGPGLLVLEDPADTTQSPDMELDLAATVGAEISTVSAPDRAPLCGDREASLKTALSTGGG